jgi:mannose-1-phosphate guanylyltransferase/mannose-6-phosphate isomerase
VLAGGAGTRLWPLSRRKYPKQFMPLIGERSLFQESLLRLHGMEGAAAPTVVCNEDHRFLVVSQARELGIELGDVVVEPAVRSTAPALTLAALRLTELGPRSADRAAMLVMPADHVVSDVDAFRRAVSAAYGPAAEGRIVAFGVVPTSPETGYGYIRADARTESSGQGRTQTDRRIVEFVEKPDAQTALRYLQSGDYLWNSGIFMMRPDVWLSELRRFRPDILERCRASAANGTIDGAFFRPGAEFDECPAESIDYAVMEKGPRAAPPESGSASAACAGYSVVALEGGWSDVGAWSAVWEQGERDPDGNVVRGDVYAESTRGSLLLGHHRLLAAVGLEDVVVVEMADAVLVARKDRVQDVKAVVDRLRADGRPEHDSHRKVHRPWGSYEVLGEGPGFQIKRLIVDPGAALSLQKHRRRAEHWVVVKGNARVTVGEERYELRENESTYVPRGSVHRLENAGESPLEVVEVQTGDYLDEDDIVRLRDDYGRQERG